jgi:hypothetical protein
MKLSLDSKLPFEEHVLSDGRKFIRFKVFGSDYAPEEANRNVFLVDAAGCEVWRIAWHECPHEDDPFHGNDPFVGLNEGSDGVITGITWDGWRFEIRMADGGLKKIGWTKG